MKRNITKREMINRVLDLANDLHETDNIIAKIRIKLHALEWDLKESSDKLLFKDGGIEKKKKPIIGIY